MGAHWKDVRAFSCERGDECPLAAVHGRIREAHRHWQQALREYDDPEGFRSCLNACIQALRNVTFVLQKAKSNISGFESWYGPWQDYLRDHEILRWAVDARNTIVKEGDLHTRSVARVSIVRTYDEPPFFEVDQNPLTPTPVIAAIVREQLPEDLPEWLVSEGMLRVERRWVVEELPDHELLEALAIAFAVLGSLAHDAHRIQSLKDDVVLRPQDIILDPPGSMEASEEQRTAWVILKTGEHIQARRHSQDIQIDELGVVDHYGEPSPYKGDGKSLRALAEYFFCIGTTILETDGYHLPHAILIGDSGAWHFGLEIPDQSSKYLVWRTVAADVARLKSKVVIAINESWKAPFDPEFPWRRAVDSPDRTEALVLSAASCDGELLSISRDFTHDGDSIVMGQKSVMEGDKGVVSMFNPILAVWKSWERPLRKRTFKRKQKKSR